MAEKKKSFILYLDMRGTLAKLSDESYGRLMKAVFDYAAEGIIPEFTDMCEDLMFSVIKTTLDRDEEKYDEICKARREAGKKGGAPFGNQNARKNKSEQTNQANNLKQAKQPDSESVNDSVSDNESESASESDSIILSPEQERKEMFGSVRNIPLTTNEYQKLCSEFTKARTDAEIEALSLSFGESEQRVRSCFALLVRKLTD